MTLEELAELIRTWEPTAEDIAAFHERMRKADEKWEERQHERAITEEFLNRTITI